MNLIIPLFLVFWLSPRFAEGGSCPGRKKFEQKFAFALSSAYLRTTESANADRKPKNIIKFLAVFE